MAKVNLWQTMFGAKRRASDRALLASLERDIANGEKIAAANARKMTAAEADAMPVHQISEEERRRIARAFGRPS
jgi:hypothetical protein